MLLNEFETTLVIRPDVGGDTIEAVLDKMRGLLEAQGKLLSIQHWGKKRLAYEIDDHTRGIYVHTHFLAPGELIHEMERHFRLSEDVIRFLTIKLNERVSVADRETVDYEKPSYDAEDTASAAEVSSASEEAPAAPAAAEASEKQQESVATAE